MSDTPQTDEAVHRAETYEESPSSIQAEVSRQLERELAAAREDARRLDWLEQQGRETNFSGLPKRDWVIEAEVWQSIRGAIDAALRPKP